MNTIAFNRLSNLKVKSQLLKLTYKLKYNLSASRMFERLVYSCSASPCSVFVFMQMNETTRSFHSSSDSIVHCWHPSWPRVPSQESFSVFTICVLAGSRVRHHRIGHLKMRASRSPCFVFMTNVASCKKIYMSFSRWCLCCKYDVKIFLHSFSKKVQILGLKKTVFPSIRIARFIMILSLGC